MGRVLGKLLGVVFTSPITLVVWAWVLLMTAASAALTFALPMIFWEMGGDILKNGVSLGDAGMALFMVAFLLGGAAFTYWVTWVSAKGAWDMSKGFVEDVQGVATATREALTERADRAEAREAQGGMLSVSLGDGVGGELSQVSPANDGLELVEEGAELEAVDEERVAEVSS